MPRAEVEVTAGLVRALLRKQHPDLADLPVRVVAHGWDTVVVRLGRHLAARLPRRVAAVPLVLGEQRWLAAATAGVQGLALPLPVRTGVPGAGFPWPWSVVRWVPGTPAVGLPRWGRGSLAAPLAGFCQQMHRPAPPDAPRNPVRGVPLRERDAVVRERLASGQVPSAGRAAQVWAAAVDAPRWDGPPVWLHGDLHPANMVLQRGRLAGVVDFGDLGAGDPATDLAAAWLTLPGHARPSFRRALGTGPGADEATWGRARGWALAMGAALCTASDDAPTLRQLGEETIAEVLAG